MGTMEVGRLNYLYPFFHLAGSARDTFSKLWISNTKDQGLQKAELTCASMEYEGWMHLHAMFDPYIRIKNIFQ